MAKIFGFEIRRAKEEPLPSFAPPLEEDGAVVVTAGAAQGAYIDLEGTVKTESELVTKYRNMAWQPELDGAINDIIGEAVIYEDNQKVIELFTDDIEELGVPPAVCKVLSQEFQHVLDLMEFNTKGFDIFKRWYIDGRIYYHMIIDPKLPQEGIQELRYLDPRKIRKIREVEEQKDPRILTANQTPAPVLRVVDEYYMYNETGLGKTLMATAYGTSPTTPVTGIKISKDAVAYCTSGLTDVSGNLVLSHLHKAIKFLNMLRSLEDAAIIYRISRAPERRVFYIDVGNLPRVKAEQHIRDMMTKYKNKLVYDAATGEIRDDRKFMTILEDFWLARRGDAKSTEIDTLPGGQSQGVMDEVNYFRESLYRCLNIPFSRYNPEYAYNIGRTAEISRDEVKFSKFIDRLRTKFCELFISMMEKQLVLKGIMTPEDWAMIAPRIKFKFARDNIFSELKKNEILMERFNLLNLAMPYVGKYVSNDWVQKQIMMMTEEEIEEIMEQIEEELSNPIYNGELMLMMSPMAQAEAGLDPNENNKKIPPKASGAKAKKKTPPKSKKKDKKK